MKEIGILRSRLLYTNTVVFEYGFGASRTICAYVLAGCGAGLDVRTGAATGALCGSEVASPTTSPSGSGCGAPAGAPADSANFFALARSRCRFRFKALEDFGFPASSFAFLSAGGSADPLDLPAGCFAFPWDFFLGGAAFP